MSDEHGRIEFLLRRDGLASTLDWVDQTTKIYRRAVLNKSHYASLPEYRRKFVQAYCDFKRWSTKARGSTNQNEKL